MLSISLFYFILIKFVMKYMDVIFICFLICHMFYLTEILLGLLGCCCQPLISVTSVSIFPNTFRGVCILSGGMHSLNAF